MSGFIFSILGNDAIFTVLHRMHTLPSPKTYEHQNMKILSIPHTKLIEIPKSQPHKIRFKYIQHHKRGRKKVKHKCQPNSITETAQSHNIYKISHNALQIELKINQKINIKFNYASDLISPKQNSNATHQLELGIIAAAKFSAQSKPMQKHLNTNQTTT